MPTPETPILDEAAVCEIEARNKINDLIISPKIDALCATVKHLRAELRGIRRGFPEWAAEWDALQSQLEQLRTIAEGALRFRVEMNGACNHDEYMTKLCTQCEIREAPEKL